MQRIRHVARLVAARGDCRRRELQRGLQLHDAVIIGAGHNGLTCAYYLAPKRAKVAVLERPTTVGGAAVTDEFLPGFRNSAASYTVSLLNPKVIRDMELERHGLKVVLRKTDNFLPGDGDYLLVRPAGADAQGNRPPRRRRWRRLRPLRRRARDGRAADPEMAPAGAAGSRGGGRRTAEAAELGARPGRPVARREAHPPRLCDAQRRRHPRPPFRGRPRQGPVRVRRRRRQFRFALHAGHAPTCCSTICSARRRACRAPGATRSAAWARSPRRWRGPRARRGRHPAQHAGRGDHRRQGQRAAGVVAGGKAWRAQAGRRRGQSEVAVRQTGAARRGRCPTSSGG